MTTNKQQLEQLNTENFAQSDLIEKLKAENEALKKRVRNYELRESVQRCELHENKSKSWGCPDCLFELKTEKRLLEAENIQLKSRLKQNAEVIRNMTTPFKKSWAELRAEFTKRLASLAKKYGKEETSKIMECYELMITFVSRTPQAYLDAKNEALKQQLENAQNEIQKLQEIIFDTKRGS